MIIKGVFTMTELINGVRVEQTSKVSKMVNKSDVIEERQAIHEHKKITKESDLVKKTLIDTKQNH